MDGVGGTVAAVGGIAAPRAVGRCESPERISTTTFSDWAGERRCVRIALRPFSCPGSGAINPSASVLTPNSRKRKMRRGFDFVGGHVADEDLTVMGKVDRSRAPIDEIVSAHNRSARQDVGDLEPNQTSRIGDRERYVKPVQAGGAESSFFLADLNRVERLEGGFGRTLCPPRGSTIGTEVDSRIHVSLQLAFFRLDQLLAMLADRLLSIALYRT